MLNLLKDFAARKQAARHLYDGLVSRAREPVFFADFGVADSLDGRFDILAFHAWLVLKELKGGELKGSRLKSRLAQSLTDTIFTGFDEAMREQGVGDIGIGHKLKAMAKAFYGRMAAYNGAKNEDELAAALARNLWRGADPDWRMRKLAAYATSASGHLAASLPQTLDFGPLPTI
jgi:cytochrome b pre-mRNA-processing protein 3